MVSITKTNIYIYQDIINYVLNNLGLYLEDVGGKNIPTAGSSRVYHYSKSTVTLAFDEKDEVLSLCVFSDESFQSKKVFNELENKILSIMKKGSKININKII